MVDIQDGLSQPVRVNIEGFRRAEKTITFAGGTANAIGDYDGTGDPFTIFSVNGTVSARVFGVCTTSLAGDSATVEIGTALDTDAIIATTTATTIDANEIWHDASPDNSVELLTVAPENIVTEDIVGNIKVANITSGVIRFICLWKPLDSQGNVTVS